MKYDFRIVKRYIQEMVFYEIHRVFYSDDARTRPTLVETRPATIVGNCATIMLEDIEAMTDAFDKPVIVIPEWDSP